MYFQAMEYYIMVVFTRPPLSTLNLTWPALSKKSPVLSFTLSFLKIDALLSFNDPGSLNLLPSAVATAVSAALHVDLGRTQLLPRESRYEFHLVPDLSDVNPAISLERERALQV